MTTKQIIVTILAVVAGGLIAHFIFKPDAAIDEAATPTSCIEACTASCADFSGNEATQCEQECNSLC